MQLSCPEQMLGMRSLAEKADLIAQAGFGGIDVRFDTLADPELAGALRHSGLPLVSVYSQIRTPSLLDATAADRASATAEVVRRARLAAEHGALSLILVPVFGPTRLTIGAGTDEIATIEAALLLVALKEIASELGNTPITIVLEPLNRGETHFLTNPSRAADICRQLGEARIATMVDTYHCFEEDQDPSAEISAVGGQLALMHFSDSDRGLPGEGEVDFGRVVAALNRNGYSGWAGWECRRIETADDIEALGRSVAHIHALDRTVVE